MYRLSRCTYIFIHRRISGILVPSFRRRIFKRRLDRQCRQYYCICKMSSQHVLLSYESWCDTSESGFWLDWCYDRCRPWDWCTGTCINKDSVKIVTGGLMGNADMTDPKPHCNWHNLCLADGNDYTKYIYELTEEVCQRYKKLDGLFYNICTNGDACYCESCKSGMIAMGMDPGNDADAKKIISWNARILWRSEGRSCRNIIRMPSYFHEYQSYFEMENLSTAWGGYDKLPMRAKVLAQKEKVWLEWQENSIWPGWVWWLQVRRDTEIRSGHDCNVWCGASIGDHMHPDGEMEMQTYENIGYAYRYLEKIALFCYGGQN